MSFKSGKSRNSHATDSCQAALDENRKLLERIEEIVAENRAILLALAERFDVTYEKPPAGFVKE